MKPLKQAVYSSRSADKFVVRLPDGMRETIAELGRQNHRSMNSEIIARLTVSIKADGVGADHDKELGPIVPWEPAAGKAIWARNEKGLVAPAIIHKLAFSNTTLGMDVCFHDSETLVWREFDDVRPFRIE